ncbi:37S ribosomal protein S9, mitochondrial [Coemansia sp. RSA 1807]|nr:37S ribosomal protein S9, mitochondrial [Coemansia sp. RSA 1752]KAJ1787224.1 37S ribosomal protein S9, mitochondrial [Coemansia sp. RSA 1938]KAJ2133414.1 37S ribosomal protein S9, mitochondrial [Coemansia sp. RSA 921]KAJ2278253.1 37S ribosomal protein S9, mitochondrial [Coemansia sp. RSA 451]KAJ2578075.1 37S ribosomal protein S9, mitochondrial [Coemansia sp. RSA 1807]KAJ2839136.1 37S ribosomal protein S9, mitochondrial [Coemansia erecta]
MYLCGSRSAAVSRMGRAAWVRFSSQGPSGKTDAKTKEPEVESPFGKLEIRPVQRPDSAAYFMPKSKYNDLMAGLLNMIQKNSGAGPNKGLHMKVITHETIEKNLEVKLSKNEYAALAERLKQASLLRVVNRDDDETMQAYLNQFRKGYSHIEYVDEEGEVVEKQKRGDKERKINLKIGGRDSLGRWVAIGRRKTARACVWLAPVRRPGYAKAKLWAAINSVDEVVAEIDDLARDVGLYLGEAEAGLVDADFAEAGLADAEWEDVEPVSSPAPESDTEVPEPQFTTFGEVLVNGKPLADYFVRPSDRDAVIFPLLVANRVGRYNVFIKVHGGGHTGQVDACQLAISRALSASNYGLRKHLVRAGLTRVDGRNVERKKTGKPKARKSYTWVKR